MTDIDVSRLRKAAEQEVAEGLAADALVRAIRMSELASALGR